MGKASSSKKVQRAARAAAASRGTSEKRELGFPLIVAAVLVLGITMVAFARTTREANANEPSLRDHWHSAYAIYDCEQFLPVFLSEFDPDGIHSHRDGLIHIHPFSNGVTGERATMSVFLDAMGAELSEDRIRGPEIGDLEAGSDCNGEETIIQVARWDADDLDADPEIITADPGETMFLKDREAFTIARVPAGADIPRPPADRLEALDAATGTARQSTSPETDPSLDPSNSFDDFEIEVPEGEDVEADVPATDDESDADADADADASDADADADADESDADAEPAEEPEPADDE